MSPNAWGQKGSNLQGRRFKELGQVNRDETSYFCSAGSKINEALKTNDICVIISIKNLPATIIF